MTLDNLISGLQILRIWFDDNDVEPFSVEGSTLLVQPTDHKIPLRYVQSLLDMGWTQPVDNDYDEHEHDPIPYCEMLGWTANL